MAFSGNADQIN